MAKFKRIIQFRLDILLRKVRGLSFDIVTTDDLLDVDTEERELKRFLKNGEVPNLEDLDIFPPLAEPQIQPIVNPAQNESFDHQQQIVTSSQPELASSQTITFVPYSTSNFSPLLFFHL